MRPTDLSVANSRLLREILVEIVLKTLAAAIKETEDPEETAEEPEETPAPETTEPPAAEPEDVSDRKSASGQGRTVPVYQ